MRNLSHTCIGEIIWKPDKRTDKTLFRKQVQRELDEIRQEA